MAENAVRHAQHHRCPEVGLSWYWNALRGSPGFEGRSPAQVCRVMNNFRHVSWEGEVEVGGFPLQIGRGRNALLIRHCMASR